ncbi:MAG: endonuclease, partial [Paramuribaculum sp.]|nr:endonuclease [Paramuribaculum sp.]
MLKKIGLPVLLAAMMLALTSCGKEVKIMSYNVRNGRGLDDVRNTERTATVIKNLNPDVVALQELDSMTQRSGTTYVLGELAELTGMTATFAPAIDYDGGKY